MLEYNTKGGKMTRGLMVVESAVIIFKARGLPIDNTTMCKFAVLGWCVVRLRVRVRLRLRVRVRLRIRTRECSETCCAPRTS